MTNKILPAAALFVCSFILTGLIVKHNVPDQRFIELAKKYPQICHFPMGEGTLVRDRWIITAGHVGNDLKRDLDNKKLPWVECNGLKYDIESVFIHPDFKSIHEGPDNDIALVKIKGTVPGVIPATEYSKTDEPGKNIILVGMGDWGTGITGPQKWDKITRAATNRIDKVEPHWVCFTFDAPGSANATELEGISGPGDSGGPAFAEMNGKRFLVGVSSFQKGQDKFGKGRYGVTEYYARVSAYSKWISTVINNYHPDKKTGVEQKNDKSICEEYAGNYGSRKIICKNDILYFQRDDEPLIPMKEIAKDKFLWDDESTSILFIRNIQNIITGFEIHRKSNEIIKTTKS